MNLGLCYKTGGGGGAVVLRGGKLWLRRRRTAISYKVCSDFHGGGRALGESSPKARDIVGK